jgi:hypothetical protein
MKVRHLPGWPPRWTSASGGAALRGRADTLRAVEWRTNLRGERDLRMTIEYRGDLFFGLYPGDSEIRAQLTAGQLDSLYRVLVARIGQQLRGIEEADI